jgi:hypothetical protein
MTDHRCQTWKGLDRGTDFGFGSHKGESHVQATTVWLPGIDMRKIDTKQLSRFLSREACVLGQREV